MTFFVKEFTGELVLTSHHFLGSGEGGEQGRISANSLCILSKNTGLPYGDGNQLLLNLHNTYFLLVNAERMEAGN